MVETEIAANTDSAVVEITGIDQSGPVPFTARLEKGKPYKARISAPGFTALEVDVMGGDPRYTAKLIPKPRLLMIASDPSGAQILIDGQPSGHDTPFEIELTWAQAAKGSVLVALRKAGFDQVDRTIDFSKFADDGTRMTATLDENLSPVQPAVPLPAPEPPVPTQNVAPTVLDANRIGGDKDISPDPSIQTEISRAGIESIVGAFKICLTAEGTIDTVTQLKSTGFPAYDTKIQSTIRRTWRYRPFIVNRRPAQVCTAVRFIYSQR